jgi:protein-disulfide isomerase/uncharacterized membrane protein
MQLWQCARRKECNIHVLRKLEQPIWPATNIARFPAGHALSSACLRRARQPGGLFSFAPHFTQIGRASYRHAVAAFIVLNALRVIHRLTLLLSLIGMVLSLHLWIQKQRHFDQGCWGVDSAAVAPVSAGCNDEGLKKYAEFLGISVAAWGYSFYFAMAALAFGKILLSERGARACHTASEMAMALAFPFAVYLAGVQAFVANAFCPLCLISGGLVTTLFILHAVQYRRGFEPLPAERLPVEIGYASAMAFLAMGVLAALMIMVNQIGTRRLDQGETARQFEAMLGKTLPKHIEPARLLEMKPALYNPELPPLDLNAWLTGELPVLGSNAGMPVVAFLDPNCPGCKGTYATIKLLAGRYDDRAQFRVISRTLWPYSELQSQALEVAAQNGKYHEMWQAQFDHAKKGGMNLAELESLFRELGLNTENLAERLADVRPTVLARREQAIAAGVRGTPTIYVNGRAVAHASTDLPSLAKLIEAELRRQDGAKR